MKQKQLSELTGIAQQNISTHLREIREGHIIRPNILKILRVQGKGDVVDRFIREVNNG
jgi:DNA-binding transcriptional ArsR family regulator